MRLPRLPRLRQCKVCRKNKGEADYFRVLLNGKISKTCYLCEEASDKNYPKCNKGKKPKNIKAKFVNNRTQKICLVCGKTKKRKSFRMLFAPKGIDSRTCRKCEILAGINLDDDIRTSKGFMYVLFDSSFPNLIKIGCTTDPEIRLYFYNKDKPVATCSYVYMSKSFKDVFEVEKYILKKIKVYAQPEHGKMEWFPVEHRNQLLAEIKLVENT